MVVVRKIVFLMFQLLLNDTQVRQSEFPTREFRLAIVLSSHEPY